MKLFSVLFLLFFCSSAYAQKVTYNHIVDESDSETKEVMRLFESYLASHPERKETSPYWNTDEQLKHKDYDFLESEFQPSLYMGFPAHVLSIKFTNNLVLIKVQFAHYQNGGTPNVLAIVNYVAKKENGVYKLYNALSLNKQNWKCTTVGMVDFYYPKYHSFDYQKAQRLNDFIAETCTNFGVKPKPFEYYLADDYDEIQKLKGIDYYLGMGGRLSPRGKANSDKVYCGGLGEYYPHEVFHVQIDPHFTDCHFWASEGIATLLGGSRGQTLNWHVKRTHTYLQNHPEVDLNNMLQLSNLDSQTSYHYVLGGLIAKKILNKGGWDMLKELMRSGKSDANYYMAIEKFLGVKQTDLNEYMREELRVAGMK